MNSILLCARLAAASLLLIFLAGVTPARAEGQADEVSLNFVNAEIDVVIRAISKISQRNFLIDPRVRGTLNIVTSKPVPQAMAYQIFLSALRLQGYAAVEESGIVKIMPEADVKLHSLPLATAATGGTAVTAGGAGGGGKLRGDQPITQVFMLKNESAVQLLPVVRPLVSPNMSMTAYGNNNTLLVTDYAENIERIGRIIDAIDVAQGDVVVIPIRYASALDIAHTVSRLMSETLSGGPGAVDVSQRIMVLPDSHTNALLVRSENPSRISAVRQLVAALDQPGVGGNIHVIYLKNAEAEKVAQTLRAILSGEVAPADGAGAAIVGASVTAATPAGAKGGAGAAVRLPGASPPPFTTGSAPGGAGMVQADRAANALIISASDVVYNNIRRVVDKLDRRRAQVYVEALVAEISVDQAMEFGVQWQSTNIPTGPSDKSTVFGGTNFSIGRDNILNVARNPSAVATGLNVLMAKGTITLPGSTTPILNLAMLARFLETQSKANILSTPNIMVLDNEEAKIVVGQNLPFVTGQYTNTGGGTLPANPFQTIERHDVGLTLRIRPQISEGGAVQLQIYQESSSVVANLLNSSTGPITNKRSIETMTLVDDGAIIALGGLVQDNYTSGGDQVPLLGDLPIIGSLFRYDTRQRSKTNLFVFLRPMILRDSESYKSLALDRYDYVLGQQRGFDRPENLMRNEQAAPQLPPLPNLPNLPTLPNLPPAPATGILVPPGSTGPLPAVPTAPG